MLLRSVEDRISPEYDGSGFKICVFSDSLDLLRVYFGVKIDIGQGISILTPSNYFFLESRAVTVQNGSFRICEARVGQNGPGLTNFIHFENIEK